MANDYTTAFFLRQKFLGATPAWRVYTYGFADSEVYFCSKCGDIWARVLMQPHTRWLSFYSDCPKHQGGGQILTDYALDQWLEGAAQFPHQLLTYEFLRRSYE